MSETAEGIETPETEEPDTEEEQEDSDLEEQLADELDALHAEDETEQPEQAEPARTEAWWNDAWKASNKEDDRHRKRVEAIFEEEAEEFTLCPMCAEGPMGVLVRPFFSDEQRATINTLLGNENPDEYEPMDGAAVCGKCKGRGKVRTPSLVPAEKVKDCMACNGLGWSYVAAAGGPSPQTFGLPPATTEQGTTIVEQPAFDAWSRPLGHPHYNIPPADVGV